MNTPKLPPLPHWCEPGSPFAEQMQAYAIAAIQAQASVEQQEPVAYLDIGAAGYIDLGTDLSTEQLQSLPAGRHTLGIIGTFGANGYVPAPQQKPMTDEQDRALCEAYCNAASDEYFKARPQLDSDVNRRIFYAGHRKAWIDWQAAHGIKERTC